MKVNGDFDGIIQKIIINSNCHIQKQISDICWDVFIQTKKSQS